MASPSPQSVAEPRRLSLLATSVVASAGTTAYFFTTSSFHGEIWNVTSGLLLALMAVNIRRFQVDRERPWLLVWVGLALAYGAGLVMAYGPYVGFDPGSPSVIDVMRLSNYVLAAAGALFVLSRYDQRTGVRATLEIIMVTTTGAMVIWFYVGLPMIESEEMTRAQTIVAAAYPLGNVLLLAVIVTVGVRLVHRPGSLILLTLGLAGNLTADFLFSVQNLRGTYEPGGWIDLGWLLCFAGLALGPAWPDPLQEVDKHKLLLAEQGHLTIGRFAMLAFALLLGPMILVDRTVNISDRSDVLVVVGSAIVSSLAVARLVLHNSDLADTEAEVRAASEALMRVNAELDEAKTERQKLLWRVQRAVEEERSRIAADIHDRPIQELTVVGYQLERVSLALARGDVDLAEEIIDGAADGLTTQLGELRTIMTDIRPPVLDERGLTGALEDFATQFMRANESTTVSIDSSVRELGSDIETVLYRVAQESLTNVSRHAGPCMIQLELAESNGIATLIITDTGRGFHHTDVGGLIANGCYGIAGMRERISMLDGEMQVDSLPGTGTMIRFSVPSALAACTPPPSMAEFAGAAQ